MTALCKVCFDPLKANEEVVSLYGKTLHSKCARCNQCACLITPSNIIKIKDERQLLKNSMLCETHYIKKYAERGLVRLQARIRGILIRSKKEELREIMLKEKILYRAATKIQAIVRGYRTRQRLIYLRHREWRKLSVEMQKCRLKALRPRNQSINEVQFNIYSEFSEFSRKQLDRYTELFNTYDIDGTGKITVEGLKRMMEKLGLPQTHLQLKALIKEVDNDNDGMISIKDFITLFRRRQKGELIPNSSSAALVNLFNNSINVREVGVGGAKAFFDGKAKLNVKGMVQQEVKQEAEVRQVKRAEKAKHKEEFNEIRSTFIKKEVSPRSN